MSTGPTTRHPQTRLATSNGISHNTAKNFISPPVPTEIESIEDQERFSVSPDLTEIEIASLTKSHLQNSSTMDSGVEDCCELNVIPKVVFDPNTGFSVTVNMLKPENLGFGFSVVWVSPPRIERLEKDKVADVAGLRIGDLIIGVNGQDVTTASNATIYQKMKSTVNKLELEVWRKHSEGYSDCSSSKMCSISTSMQPKGPGVNHVNIADEEGSRKYQRQANNNSASTFSTTATTTPLLPSNRLPQHPIPVSILKSTPTPPSVKIGVIPPPPQHSQQQQMISQQNNSSSWRIRFNIELLDNEDDFLRKFFIQELKFFRKVVSALDRYLIPAQANRLLTPQEIHLIFAHIITIITMTKRILQCVANGASSTKWNLGKILHSTHSDHLTELKNAYTSYGTNLGNSAMILSEKMSMQAFARFVIETPVPKGHLDMTYLLFAPFEHLRNLCEISDEIAHNHESWTDITTQLKECYADIVVQTDFMEPISHVTMKKNPLLSVRDLEKRIVLTNCQQALKVSEKGRKWLFGSRLFRRETDGSWSPVWAFLFSDCIVLTSHTTRDRVFFVKEPPIRLEDVVTLHFNLPRKNENEFRLLLGPEPQPNRLDKILPIYRNKCKSNQAILRTTNVQLKSMWKLLLQRQIITLNTRLSKSSSSNFSISEFCEKFPVNSHLNVKDDVPSITNSPAMTVSQLHIANVSNSLKPEKNSSSPSKLQQNLMLEKFTTGNLVPSKPEPTKLIAAKPNVGIHAIAKELLLKNRMIQIPEHLPTQLSDNVNYTPSTSESDTTKIVVVPPQKNIANNSVVLNCGSNCNSTNSSNTTTTNTSTTKSVTLKTCKISDHASKTPACNNNESFPIATPSTPVKNVVSSANPNLARNLATIHENSPSKNQNNNNNNNIKDLNDKKGYGIDKCLCSNNSADLLPQPRHLDGDLSKDKTKKNRNNDLNFELKSKAESTTCKNTASMESNHSKLSRSTNICNDTPAKTTFQSESHELSGTSTDKATTGVNVNAESKICRSVTVEKSCDSPDLNFSEPKVMNSRLSSNEAETSTKVKPGCKIITNATLKSRQQEFLTSRLQTEISSDTIITDKSDVTYKTDSTQYQSIRQPNVMGTIQNFMENSSSPSFRCHSENGQTATKLKHIKDSPIVSGYGSEKSRRRLLYDYKIKRDYPELFGITPKDRRSFIKKLAVDNEKVFVAPYYYRAYSPIATPKQPKSIEVINSSATESSTISAEEENSTDKDKPVSLPKPVLNIEIGADLSELQETSEMTSAEKTEVLKVESSEGGREAEISSNTSVLLLEDKLCVENAEEEDVMNKTEKKAKETKEDLSLVEELEDDSEAESGTQDQEENQANNKTNRRSPEESSNDSGISDEITDKSKSTATSSVRTSGDGRSNTTTSCSVSISNNTNTSDFDPFVSISTSSPINSVLISHGTQIQVSTPATYKIIEEEELELDNSMQTTSRNSSIGMTEGDALLIDGQEEEEEGEGQTSAPSLAVCSNTKVDKSTATDDYMHFCWMSHLPEKSIRSIMAERREAFFQNQVSMTSSSGASTAAPTTTANEPLIVKIVQGGTVHSTEPTEEVRKAPCERVMYSRFEKETTARVERVESSDDSTSSDAASASPAAENGTTDPSWSSSSSSLAGYSSFKEDTSTSQAAILPQTQTTPSSSAYSQMFFTSNVSVAKSTAEGVASTSNGTYSNIQILNGSVHNYYQIARGPAIVVTQDSPDTPSGSKNDYSSEGEIDSIVLNGKTDSLSNGSDENGRERQELLRVESNDSTAENFGDDDDDDYNFEDDDEEDLSHCSIATINRYGTYESLEKIETDDNVGVLPEFPRTMSRSKARFTFEDDEDDEDLFEEDFESDFNFRFPTQIQDNTYSVSRLGPLPPLLEEDFEDDMYDEQRGNGASPSGSNECSSNGGASLRSRHETGLRRDNSFLLARLATMYARSSISPLKILRELWLKKRITSPRNETEDIP